MDEAIIVIHEGMSLRPWAGGGDCELTTPSWLLRQPPYCKIAPSASKLSSTLRSWLVESSKENQNVEVFYIKFHKLTSGGKSFSKNLAPLGPDGEEVDVQSQTPDRWQVLRIHEPMLTAAT